MASSAYERRIQRYLAAHPGATRKEARGHRTTAEHGTAAVERLPGGREVSTTRSAQAADRVINQAAADGAKAARNGKPGPRVYVEVWDKNHVQGRDRPLHAYDNTGHRRGWSARDLKEMLDRSGKNLREFLEDTYFAEPGEDTDGAAVQPEGITAIQITVYP